MFSPFKIPNVSLNYSKSVNCGIFYYKKQVICFLNPVWNNQDTTILKSIKTKFQQCKKFSDWDMESINDSQDSKRPCQINFSVSAIHSICSLSPNSRCLYLTVDAVLGAHTMVLESLRFWNLYWNWLHLHQGPVLSSLQGLWFCHMEPCLSFSPWLLQSWGISYNSGYPCKHDFLKTLFWDSSPISQCKHQLFSMTPSYLQSQCQLRLSKTSVHMICSLCAFWTITSMCLSQVNAPRFTICTGSSLFLLIFTFLAPHNQHQLSQ